MSIYHRVMKETREAESFIYGVTDSANPFFNWFSSYSSTSKNRIREERENLLRGR